MLNNVFQLKKKKKKGEVTCTYFRKEKQYFIEVILQNAVNSNPKGMLDQAVFMFSHQHVWYDVTMTTGPCPDHQCGPAAKGRVSVISPADTTMVCPPGPVVYPAPWGRRVE